MGENGGIWVVSRFGCGMSERGVQLQWSGTVTTSAHRFSARIARWRLDNGVFESVGNAMIGSAQCAILLTILLLAPVRAQVDGRWPAEGVFFREHWAEFDQTISNSTGRMLRVNDAELSLHETFGRRPEARANGFTLIDAPEDLFELQGADLYLELWGGHPKTADKRFLINGRGPYALPERGCAAGHCVYTYPLVSLDPGHLVTGHNAVQFACDRGESFWGHFIIDETAIRCYLKPGHPDLTEDDLQSFKATVTVEAPDGILGDTVSIGLFYPKSNEDTIVAVEYFGRYTGFDDNGDGQANDWHGYTHDRQFVHHIGKAITAPFSVTWDTKMLLDQDGPMALRALIRFESGLLYWTPILDGLSLSPGRNPVRMYACSEMPTPFWSRNSELKTATVVLSPEVSHVEQAKLTIKIWDGGEGTVETPFKINGHPYAITSGRAIHDVVFKELQIDPAHLKAGANTLTVLSDTEHHGIEVLLPGPCLLLRYGSPLQASRDVRPTCVREKGRL